MKRSPQTLHLHGGNSSRGLSRTFRAWFNDLWRFGIGTVDSSYKTLSPNSSKAVIGMGMAIMYDDFIDFYPEPSVYVTPTHMS